MEEKEPERTIKRHLAVRGEGTAARDRLLQLRSVATRLRLLFIARYQVLNIIVLVCSCIIGGILVYQLMFVHADTSEGEEIGADGGLKTSIIDNLELWIEERQTAYESPPDIPKAIFSSSE